MLGKKIINEMLRVSKIKNQKALSEELGVAESYITKIKNSDKISDEISEKIKIFESKYGKLIYSDDEEYTIIRLFPNIKASCANGSVCVMEDYDIQEMRFPTSYLLNYLGINCAKNVHAIVADGNSMEPLIKDGDILFVTPFDILRDGNVYIVNVNGDIYCKKVYKNPITKGLTLRGENETAPKYEILENDMDNVKFMGEVFVVMNVNVLRRLR
ncbi:MAG: S24 family peptidase [Erysipelotrichia bacterium]|nr:S24 family peptidase [Erysipelotrichia bacterium]